MAIALSYMLFVFLSMLSMVTLINVHVLQNEAHAKTRIYPMNNKYHRTANIYPPNKLLFSII